MTAGELIKRLRMVPEDAVIQVEILGDVSRADLCGWGIGISNSYVLIIDRGAELKRLAKRSEEEARHQRIAEAML